MEGCNALNVNQLKLEKTAPPSGKQNYLCRDCGRQFVDLYSPQGYPDDIKEQCLKMYVNGIGFRGIERVCGVHHTNI